MGKKNINPNPASKSKPAADNFLGWKNSTIGIAILLVCFLLYGNTLKNKFSIDDSYVTNGQPYVIKGIQGIPKIFTNHTITNTKGESYSYRPLVLASFAIEHSLFGEKPGISHLINLLLYAMTCYFLFLFLKKLFPVVHQIVPLLIAFLFLIHPIHSEPVNNIKSRDELLAILFSVLSLTAFLRYANNARLIFLLTGGIWFFLGILSKASALPVIFLAPLTIYFFTHASWKKILATALVPVLFSFALFAFVRLVLPEGNSREYVFHENPLAFEKDISMRIGTSLYSLGYYLRLVFFPHPLLYYYGYEKIPLVGIGNIWVILSLIAHVLLFGFAMFKLREKNIFSFAILFYLGSIAMYSNLAAPSPGLVADRFLYLASIGFCTFAGVGILKLFKINYQNKTLLSGKLTFFISLCAVLFIVSAGRIVTRNADWKNQITLYANDHRFLSNSVKGNLDYGSQLLLAFKNKNQWETEEKKTPEKKIQLQELKDQLTNLGFKSDMEIVLKARECFERATVLVPEYFNGWTNLGTTYFFTGEFEQALKHFNKAYQLKPDELEVKLNLAAAHEQLNQPAKAIEFNEQCILQNPSDNRAWIQIKRVFDSENNYQEWIAFNKKLADSNLMIPRAYNTVGDNFMKSGDRENALYYYALVYPMDSGNFALVNNLAHIYEENGETEKSKFFYSRLEKLNALRK